MIFLTVGIIFQIKRILLENKKVIYCAWIARDPDELGEYGRMSASMTLGSSFNSSIYASNMKDLPSRPTSQNVDHQNEDEPWYGSYENHYVTLETLGKGAFGFVQLAERKSDQKSCVVKFIQKSKIFNESWMTTERFGKVPLEIYFLSQLNHPNIVRMIDAYENKDYFQVVMEKHGSGMDLFEFIECGPNFDEALASYIFRQIVSAVSYLHQLKIVHRDIKDENIIIDEQFVVKLIDFGSAAFIEPGKLFATFCGTVEYCAPEVLLGNKYPGPELDMFALGVTLYTLTFGENPFLDPDETIKGRLKPPFPVSKPLLAVVTGLLHPNPSERATIKNMEKNQWVNQPVDITRYRWDVVIHQQTLAHKKNYDPIPIDDGNDGESWDESDSEMQLQHEIKKYLDSSNEANRLNSTF